MKVCFLSLSSYPVLAEKNFGSAGGAEVEQVSLAKELALHDYDVSFVTYDYGQRHLDKVGKIEVIKTYRREEASEMNPFMKLVYIWKALKKADADLYFYEAGSDGVLPFFCYASKKKFVFRVPSDEVVIAGTRKITAKLANRLDITRADIVITQNHFQERALKERFGVKSVVIKNGLPLQRDGCEKWNPPVVLWVGSISDVKRPQIFVELAKALPYAPFKMVGGKTKNINLFENIKNATKFFQNFAFHGFVPYHEVDRYFAEASIFVNTSKTEGFPNTFIQAWAHYTPVVSLSVDPDRIIRNEKLGFCSRTFKQLVSDVTLLLGDEKFRKNMGEYARKYVEREHDIEKIVQKYIKIFKKIL